MSELRILLTGSRAWPFAAREVLAGALWDLVEQHGADRPVVLAHGACNPKRGSRWVPWASARPDDPALSGADWHGHWIATAAGWRTESHPADWNGPLGTGAGPVRNAKMARLGAAVCVAARVRGVPSLGTDDCVAKVRRVARERRASVEVVDVWWPR